MLLKFTATLIVAGLLTQSSAFILKGVQNDPKPLPGFYYPNETDAAYVDMGIIAGAGSMRFKQISRNLSAWGLYEGEDFKTISQEVAYPFLGVIYEDIQANYGAVTSEDGMIYADFGKASYNISLSASENDNKCTLAAKIEKLKTGLDLFMVDMNWAFHAPDVVDDLKAVISVALADVLPATLTDLLEEILGKKFDKDALCKQILASKPDNIPEPRL